MLALRSDEEAGGDLGARVLVDRHAELLDGIRYAIGEFGGFTMEIAGRRFYPIQVAEKQVCWTRAIVRGHAGHGSLPLRGGAMARLARLLRTLARRRLPVHVTDVTRGMLETISSALPAPVAATIRGLLNPRLTDGLLRVLGEPGRAFDPLLHNTVNATVVQAGDEINVAPSEAFLPMQLPPQLRFLQLLHAADERLPADAVQFGTEAIRAVLERYGR